MHSKGQMVRFLSNKDNDWASHLQTSDLYPFFMSFKSQTHFRIFHKIEFGSVDHKFKVWSGWYGKAQKHNLNGNA